MRRQATVDGRRSDSLRSPGAGCPAHVVRKVLGDAARDGLAAQHHFYVSFRTDYPGVRVSQRAAGKVPAGHDDRPPAPVLGPRRHRAHLRGRLSFSGVPERLLVPFEAVTGFFDPSVQFGLKFELNDGTATAEDAAPPRPPRPCGRSAAPAPSRASRCPRSRRSAATCPRSCRPPRSTPRPTPRRRSQRTARTRRGERDEARRGRRADRRSPGGRLGGQPRRVPQEELSAAADWVSGSLEPSWIFPSSFRGRAAEPGIQTLRRKEWSGALSAPPCPVGGSGFRAPLSWPRNDSEGPSAVERDPSPPRRHPHPQPVLRPERHRCNGTTGPASGARSRRTACRTWASTSVASITEKLAPMQTRGPAPKGR